MSGVFRDGRQFMITEYRVPTYVEVSDLISTKKSFSSYDVTPVMKVGFIIAAFAATVQAFAPSSTNGRTTSSSLAMAMERTYIMIKPVSVWFEYVTCGGRA